MASISELQLEDIPSDLINAFIQQAVCLGNGRLALVGGAVRDSLLSIIDPNFSRQSSDIDFIYEGDIHLFCTGLQAFLGSRRIQELRFHDSFGTANLLLDDLLIDLASARLETYPILAENPSVVLVLLKMIFRVVTLLLMQWHWSSMPMEIKSLGSSCRHPAFDFKAVGFSS